MNILKRIVCISLVIIGCGCNGDNSDSSKLKVTLYPENYYLSSQAGLTTSIQISVVVIDETNDTEVPDVEVTITSSVPQPTVFLLNEDFERSSTSSLVVYTDENGYALFLVEITVDEEMEILITANVNSSTASSTITVEPL